MEHKNVTLGIAAVISALIAATTLQAATISTNAQLVGGMASTNVTAAAPMDTTFTVQKTATSVMDELPGHEMHQAVVALPARDDGKIWVGTVTWTSSKPIEVRILHDYNSSITVDEVHGKPLIAPFGNGTTAISLILQAGAPAESIRGFYAGSMNFAGNQLAFHTVSGEKFTVTYTIDAVAKDKSQ